MLRLRSLKARVICLGLMLAALAMVLTTAVPAPAEAYICGVETRYYSDASYTTEVGIRAHTPSWCECVAHFGGVVTSYYKNKAAPCDYVFSSFSGNSTSTR